MSPPCASCLAPQSSAELPRPGLSPANSGFLCPPADSKAGPRAAGPRGPAGMATGQPGGEGESVFSKILPGGAAEQAGKLTEGEGCSRDGDRAVMLFCTEPESGTLGMAACSRWDAVLSQFGAQGGGGLGRCAILTPLLASPQRCQLSARSSLRSGERTAQGECSQHRALCCAPAVPAPAVPVPAVPHALLLPSTAGVWEVSGDLSRCSGKTYEEANEFSMRRQTLSITVSVQGTPARRCLQQAHPLP